MKQGSNLQNIQFFSQQVLKTWRRHNVHNNPKKHCKYMDINGFKKKTQRQLLMNVLLPLEWMHVKN